MTRIQSSFQACDKQQKTPNRVFSASFRQAHLVGPTAAKRLATSKSLFLSVTDRVRIETDLLKNAIELLERKELDRHLSTPLLPTETNPHLGSKVLCQSLFKINHMGRSSLHP